MRTARVAHCAKRVIGDEGRDEGQTDYCACVVAVRWLGCDMRQARLKAPEGHEFAYYHTICRWDLVMRSERLTSFRGW